MHLEAWFICFQLLMSLSLLLYMWIIFYYLESNGIEQFVRRLIQHCVFNEGTICQNGKVQMPSEEMSADVFVGL